MFAGSLCLGASLCFAASTTSEKQPATSTKKAVHHTAHHSRKHRTKVRGQKAIDGERVREIQQALIREHYLKGQPSGKWDDATQAAMHKYQADQGWQSKTVPDSRALIRLGLGPDHEHLLNPESAMTTEAPQTLANESAHAVPAHAAAAPAPTAVSAPATVTSMPAASASTPVSVPADLSQDPSR